MPKPGGEASKLGNHYEALWTVRVLLELLLTDYTSVTLEPYKEEGVGIEFKAIHRSGRIEYHQVKRQRSQRYSIKSLLSEGILDHFRNHLVRDQNNICVFVSLDPPADLRELCECAQRTAHYNDFLQYLDAHSRKVSFQSIILHWPDLTQEQCYSILTRINIRSQDEHSLTSHISSLISLAYISSPDLVLNALYAALPSQVSRTLYPDTVAGLIETSGQPLVRQPLHSDTNTERLLHSLQSRFRQATQHSLISGSLYDRAIASEAIATLSQEDGPSILIVTGAATAGKTSLLLSILNHCTVTNLPALPIKLDTLSDLGNSTFQLGRNLDLPCSPAILLNRYAGDRGCALIIDQLDAFSEVSGKDPTKAQRVFELIEEASNMPGMKIIIACKQFDLHYDSRFKSLQDCTRYSSHTIEVPHLTSKEVHNILEQSQTPPTTLSRQQLELLRTPLLLKLFIDNQHETRFSTESDILQSYWTHLIQALQRDNIPIQSYYSGLDAVIDYLLRDRALSAPARLLHEREPTVYNHLLRSSLLIEVNGRLLFWHQSVLNFVVAKRFSMRGVDLATYLQSSEQHLFYRGFVTYVLSEYRFLDFDSYIRQLDLILNSSDIRFHIKRVVFQWVRSLPEPKDAEWQMLRHMLSGSDNALAKWAAIGLRGSGWFRLLVECGWVDRGLDSETSKHRDDMINYVASFATEEPDIVLDYVERWLSMGGEWKEIAWRALGMFRHNIPQRAVTVAMSVIPTLSIEELRRLPFASGNMLFWSLQEEAPGLAVDFFTAWLKALLSNMLARGLSNPFAISGSTEESISGDMDHFFGEVATRAPDSVLRNILPMILDLALKHVKPMGEIPQPDSVFPYLDLGYDFRAEYQLCNGVASALERSFAVRSEATNGFYALLHDCQHLQLAGWLLAKAFIANPGIWHQEALSLLDASPGYLGLGEQGASHVLSVELIAAITPYLESEDLLSLEAKVMRYYPSWELECNIQSLRRRGFYQWKLLEAFADSHLSILGRRRLQELQRKFEEESGSRLERQTGVAYFVGPPFDADWSKMSGAAWLRAMRKYVSDDHFGRDLHRGGASQLASQLKTQIASDPMRFQAMLSQLPSDLNHHYYSAILDGLADYLRAGSFDSSALALVTSVVRFCHQLEVRPFGREICRVIGAWPESAPSEEVIGILEWYACMDPDPSSDAVYSSTRDISFHGLNSVRGGSAGAIAHLLFQAPSLFELLKLSVASLAQDKSLLVRSQAPRALLPVLNIDRDFAVELFTSCLAVDGDLHFSSYLCQEFLSYVALSHYEALCHTFEVMLNASDSSVVSQAAKYICFASIEHEEAQGLVKRLARGHAGERHGVAAGLAALCANLRIRAEHVDLLIGLFDDEDVAVREQAVECFRSMTSDFASEYDRVIFAFISSRAFGDKSFSFFDSLEKIAGFVPEVTIAAYEASAKHLQETTLAEEMHKGRFADRNASIIVQVYENSECPEVKRRCLDVIDELAKSDAIYHFDRQLMEYTKK